MYFRASSRVVCGLLEGPITRSRNCRTFASGRRCRFSVMEVQEEEQEEQEQEEEEVSPQEKSELNLRFNGGLEMRSHPVRNGGRAAAKTGGAGVGKYAKELGVAVKAVHLACALCQRVQDRLLRDEEKVNSKQDNSFVTVADWSVQAVISWLLSEFFDEGDISIIAEEDTDALNGAEASELLQRVVTVVNESLMEAETFGLNPPLEPLKTVAVLNAINKCSSRGGSVGRHWVLDPVDGTLGFVRGDQYAVALAMIDDGEVVLGVLGCPNYPMDKEWLNNHQIFSQLNLKLSSTDSSLWSKGFVLSTQKGSRQVWMEPLMNDALKLGLSSLGRPVSVSPIDDPTLVTYCEPVERANSSHSFTAGLAQSLGLRNRPLRVYSMAKYAAIARGDAEIFMKFARAGYKEKIWDHAAGVIIIEEAGGVVTDASGSPLDFSQGVYLEKLDRGIVACSGRQLHEKILAAIDASWKSSEL